MTKFVHQQHSGRRKKPKGRKRRPIGIKSFASLKAHRELEYLRHPNRGRAQKLREVQR